MHHDDEGVVADNGVPRFGGRWRGIRRRRRRGAMRGGSGWRTCRCGVGVFLAAILLRPGEAEEACFVGEFAGLAKELFPVVSRKALVVPLSAS